jgi:translation initiation factor 2 subunit 1
MKSKTVASIMRHVASKLPSGSLEAAEVQAAAEAAAAPTETPEKESKKSRRARQAAQEDDGDEGAGGVNEEERLEKLYDAVGWPLGKKYGHTYDAFKLALTFVFISSFLHYIGLIGHGCIQ